MRRSTAVLAVLLAVVAVVSLLAAGPARAERLRHRHGPPPPPPESTVSEPVVLSTQRHLLKQLDDMTERLAAVTALVDVGLRGDARDRALAELGVLRRHTQDVREAIRTAPPIPATTVVHETVVVPPEPAAPVPMAEPDFAAALEAVSAEGSSRGKLRVLSDVAPQHWFTVDQVKRVIESLSFAKDRTTALELLAPRIVDPEGSFRIYDSFTFDSEKEEARRILSRAR